MRYGGFFWVALAHTHSHTEAHSIKALNAF